MVFTLMYLAKKGKSNPAPWVVWLVRAGRLSVIHFPKTPLTEHSRPAPETAVSDEPRIKRVHTSQSGSP
jgi:hypothetical protein